MDFSLTEEQRAIQDTFRAFALREIRPHARALDEQPVFPRDLFGRVGELGFFAMRYPEPEGNGADLFSYLLAVEELAWGSLAVAAVCTMQSLMGTFFLHRFAPAAERSRLLLPALRGEKVSAICMTEPDAGSDLMSITTRAERRGDRWVISGRKTWVTNAPVADFFTVFARTGEKDLGVFLVERGTRGVQVGRAIEKLGVRAASTSEVAFDEAEATCPLGEPNGGGRYLREILVEIRLMTSALALGVGRAAYEDALAYSKERKQFGKPICQHQMVQEHLAEMATDLEAARRLTQWVAWKKTQGTATEVEASQAKLFASEAAMRVTDRASRVLASYGFATDYDVQRYLRDARFTIVGGGTSEILRVNIGKGLSA